VKQVTIEVNEETWEAIGAALQKMQTQVPGERPGTIIIKPLFDSPAEWMAELLHQNVAQLVPAAPQGAALAKIAEAEALKREAEDLIKAQRGLSVRVEDVRGK